MDRCVESSEAALHDGGGIRADAAGRMVEKTA
jgi:hypothetical protein